MKMTNLLFLSVTFFLAGLCAPAKAEVPMAPVSVTRVTTVTRVRAITPVCALPGCGGAYYPMPIYGGTHGVPIYPMPYYGGYGYPYGGYPYGYGYPGYGFSFGFSAGGFGRPFIGCGVGRCCGRCRRPFAFSFGFATPGFGFGFGFRNF